MKIENKAFDFQGISIEWAAMLNRRELTDRIRLALSRARVVLLVGPRQVGKTVITILHELGFSEVRQRGSHKQFRDARGRLV